jgi:hypothetical protein
MVTTLLKHQTAHYTLRGVGGGVMDLSMIGYFDSGFPGFNKNAKRPNRAREIIASHHG